MAKPVALIEVIKGIKKKFPVSINATAVVPIWKLVVGEKLANHCKPVGYKGGKLQVICSSALWASVLMSSETMIIEKIKIKTGSDLIQGFSTVIRDVKQEPGKETKKIPLKPLTEEMVVRSEELSESLPDELKESFQRAYITQKRSPL